MATEARHRVGFRSLPIPGERLSSRVPNDKDTPGRFGLTLMEEVVLIRRGHMAPRKFTLAEIAELNGLSRERVRQIQRQALGKLKQHPQLRKLLAA